MMKRFLPVLVKRLHATRLQILDVYGKALTWLPARARADPFVPQLYRVGRVRRELPDTVTLELAPLAGTRPAFQPGQFNMLYAFGVGEVADQHERRPADERRLRAHRARCRRGQRRDRET